MCKGSQHLICPESLLDKTYVIVSLKPNIFLSRSRCLCGKSVGSNGRQAHFQ